MAGRAVELYRQAHKLHHSLLYQVGDAAFTRWLAGRKVTEDEGRRWRATPEGARIRRLVDRAARRTIRRWAAQPSYAKLDDEDLVNIGLRVLYNFLQMQYGPLSTYQAGLVIDTDGLPLINTGTQLECRNQEEWDILTERVHTLVQRGVRLEE